MYAKGRGAIRIRNFAFESPRLAVAVGMRLCWINWEAGNPVNAHTTTSGTGIRESPLLDPDSRGVFDFQFNHAGTFPYHCTPHPQMERTVSVAFAALPMEEAPRRRLRRSASSHVRPGSRPPVVAVASFLSL